MAQRYEYQDIDGHIILLFVHPALIKGVHAKILEATEGKQRTTNSPKMYTEKH